jgi:hypothetical protein
MAGGQRLESPPVRSRRMSPGIGSSRSASNARSISATEMRWSMSSQSTPSRRGKSSSTPGATTSRLSFSIPLRAAPVAPTSVQSRPPHIW